MSKSLSHHHPRSGTGGSAGFDSDSASPGFGIAPPGSRSGVPAPGSDLARCPALERGSQAQVSAGGAQNLQRVLGNLASSVAVVTTCLRGTPVGLLVTSLASISNRPPRLMFSISSTSAGWPALEQAEHLGIHLLTADQKELASRFSAERSDGFSAPSSWQPGPYGVPILDGCAAWTMAHPQQRIHSGNHVIIVARLEE